MALHKIYLISCIAFLSINTNAQLASKNLVKNHSFDKYLDCPNYFAKYRGTISQCRYWYNLYNGSPDFYHICYGPGEICCASNGIPYGAGYQYPKTGEGKKTEYTLVAAPPKPVKADLQARFDDLTCDLTRLYDGEDPFAEASA
jgi:hypothetical protein